MIHAAILGYGNLGIAAQKAVLAAPDMQLCGIYTKRAAALRLQREAAVAGVPFLEPQALNAPSGSIDVILNCGGSAKDLPRTTAALAGHFCVVDSFDTHAAIPEHYAAVDTAARSGRTLCVISAGWDPGLFSLARLLGSAFLPDAVPATFWGPGISQGHSEVLRRLPDVLDARQYTIPREDSLQAARCGASIPSAPHCHRRVCYIVPRPGADLPALETAIRSIPNYFAGYETEIHFVTEEYLLENHNRLPHGGSVICTQTHTPDAKQSMELRLELASNPDFTAGILVACARAAVTLHRHGEYGCRTMLDIPPSLYAPQDGSTLRARWL